MQIAKSTDYAIRVLIYSSTKPDILVTQQEIADFFTISREHLRKIVHELSKAGYIETRRGHNGGFSLAKPASEINLGEVVSMFEHKDSVIDCDVMSCVLIKNCRLHKLFNEAEAAFMDSLKQYSLEDVVSGPMRRLILR
jgi:Rrf2 family nitric oxide-sensitive transcriptional repressor